MPSVVIKTGFATPAVFNQAILVVDADQTAERVVLYDRRDLTILSAANNTPAGIVRIRVPDRYAVTNDLLVGILDDGGQFNAAFADGVRAEIIDGNVTSIR